MSLFVGAYAASPTVTAWDPAVESEYLTRVLGIPGVRGLELPWPGSLHAHDPAWLLNFLPASCDLVVSDIGFTVGSLAKDAAFGLASNDPTGRSNAVDAARRLRDDVARLADRAGRAQVVAVELHSAPLASAGTAAALEASLREIAGWAWSGAELVIEHCDTLVAGQRNEKGYLPIAAEIQATAAAGVGISINWGRSAIELRDADAVTAHISDVRDAGLLRGLMLSGASDRDNVFGLAWEDNHLPLAAERDGDRGAASSLLTDARVVDALRAAGSEVWRGIKMGFRPMDGSTDDRIAMLAAAALRITGAVAELDATHPR